MNLRVALAERLRDPDCAGMVKHGFDIDEWLDDPTNLLLIENGTDIVMLEGDGQGVYNLHWLLASRGKSALAVAERLLRRTFVQHGAVQVFGWTPVHLRAARWFNRKIGGTSLGTRQTEWGLMEGFSLTREQFEARYVVSYRQASEEQSLFMAPIVLRPDGAAAGSAGASAS
jgi:hypothetical protein